MGKSKLGRVLFRKIGGRIVPIKISNVADKAANASSYGDKFRHITAKLPDGEQIAKLNLRLEKKGKATLVSVGVEEKFRKRGIAKNLFARATQFLERAGFKFLRSEEIQHGAQVKIRSSYGRYKAGAKSKNRTKFIADQFGPYGEGKMRINRDLALEILKRNYMGRQITATTMLKKAKKK